jgi:hypothetical protein
LDAFFVATYYKIMDVYALYLDDIRHPPLTGDNWVLCRKIGTMLDVLIERGIPVLASFDYELGRTDPSHTGADALSAFLDFIVSNPPAKDEPMDIEVRLHTSSSSGAAEMAQLLKKRMAACKRVGVRLLFRD